MPAERFDVSSSGRASAARSSRAAWRRRGPRCSCSSAGSRGRRAPSRARRASGAERCGRPRRVVHGLFEYHHFKGLDSLTASGLGGGSLIYANVMLRKDPETFAADGLPLAARRPRSPLRRRPRDAARRALPVGRPHAQDARAAGRRADRGPAAPSARRWPWPSASARAQPFDDGSANLHGAPRADLPAVRRLRRRLPVRVQADGRLHLPDRGGRRRRARAHVL